MAIFSNPSHSDSNAAPFRNQGHSDYYIHQYPGFYDKSYINDMDTISNDSSNPDRVNVFIIFVFILEFLVLVFVIVLEYFLRFTDVFPVRHLLFSCNDPTIAFSTSGDTYEDFAYDADIPHEVVYSLSFCIPPFVIMIGEIALWAFTEENQKSVRVLCRQCKIPQIIRRCIRYIGAFLFGMFLTMIFTDVTKIFFGRLRPNFLEECNANRTICGGSDALYDEDICLEQDDDVLREARLSFPSIHASISAFAAGYLAIYLHNIIRAHSVRILRPFVSLSFILLSLMCGYARYGLHYSHWEDILCGFLLGMTLAIYIGVFVLNNFREELSSRRLYTRLRSFLAEHRTMELRDMYKEDRLDHYSYFGIPAYNPNMTTTYTYSGAIPRAHMRGGDVPQSQLAQGQTNGGLNLGESSTDPVRSHDTFQRDLHQTLDQYHRQPEPEGFAHM